MGGDPLGEGGSQGGVLGGETPRDLLGGSMGGSPGKTLLGLPPGDPLGGPQGDPLHSGRHRPTSSAESGEVSHRPPVLGEGW
jgi:hypothetical protein